MEDWYFSCYKEVLKVPAEKITSVGETVLIPRFSKLDVEHIIGKTQSILKEGKPLKRLYGDVIVVGDIHGSFHDVLRIIAVNGLNNKLNYLFLGDYVDRGEFSFDVMVFLFVLKNKYPDRIHLIRGNHEFRHINEKYGFRDEILSIFGDDKLWESFNETFDYLPLAAIINDTVFCVHGGLSPLASTIKAIENIKLPHYQDSDLVEDLVWSDPSQLCNYFGANERGRGCIFSHYALHGFLTENNLSLMIRGHESVNGVNRFFNGIGATVFTSSIYTKNEYVGYAYVTKNNATFYILPILSFIMKQDDANFYEPVYPTETKSMLSFATHIPLIRTPLMRNATLSHQSMKKLILNNCFYH